MMVEKEGRHWFYRCLLCGKEVPIPKKYAKLLPDYAVLEYSSPSEVHVTIPTSYARPMYYERGQHG
jgi:hypothetical protein